MGLHYMYVPLVPSRSHVYEALLAEEATSTTLNESLQATVPCYLNEGILIQEEQWVNSLPFYNKSLTSYLRHEVVHKVCLYKKNFLDFSEEESSARAMEIEKRRERLMKHINDWCNVIQQNLVLQIGDVVARQAISRKSADTPKNEILYLPSDFTKADCIKFDLVKLGEHKHHFLEGTLCDFVTKIKTKSKTVDAWKANKKAQAYGQQGHTWAMKQVHDVKECQDVLITHYLASRAAMLSLGMSPDDPSFPKLTLEDTYWKVTHSKHAVGDSRTFDGLLWMHSRVMGGMQKSHASTSMMGSSELTQTAMIGTQVVHSKCIKPSTLLIFLFFWKFLF